MNHKYETTHPWITFSFDVNRMLDSRIWLLLGEAGSKCEHIKGAPLLPHVMQSFYNVYLAKGALATTAIEGNTLTESEVEKRIQGQLVLPPSKEYLGKDIDNILAAINLIGKQTLNTRSQLAEKLSIEGLQEYNRLVLTGLPIDENVTPGLIRTYPVTIATYRGAPPEDCVYLLNRYVNWLNNEFNALS